MNTLASTRKGQQRCSALDQSAEVGLEADTREKQLQKEVAYLKLELQLPPGQEMKDGDESRA